MVLPCVVLNAVKKTQKDKEALMPCMCGATDCPRCYPVSFQRINGRETYTAELEDDEIEALKERIPPHIEFGEE